MGSNRTNMEKGLVIVTGGSGLIGSTLINQLVNNYHVISLDKGVPNPQLKAREISTDISSQESIESAMNIIRSEYGNKIASVVHLAAYYDFAGKPSDLYDSITVQGTKKLIQALEDFEVEQFIFSSSLLVYKPTQPGTKIHEDYPILPKWDYPKSKVQAEVMIKKYRKNIPSCVLRIAGVYSNKGNSVPIANQIQRIYEKQITSHFFPGDVSHGNPFIHLNDLVSAIIKCINNRHHLPAETVLNIGEPETLSYDYLQKNIGILIHGKPWTTYRIPKFLAKAGAWVQQITGDSFIKPWMIDMADDHMELDITKAKQMIYWEPQHSLKDSLPEIIKELKSNPKKWYRENKLK